MKSLLVALLLVATTAARAADALILISPEAAGPKVDPGLYTHGEWLLWPPAHEGGTNRLMSLLSGMDWRGRGDELAFGGQGSAWISSAFESLRSSGYFAARGRIVEGSTVAIEPATPASLFLALDGRSPQPRSAPLARAERGTALWVAEAANWDVVAEITRAARGRVLVVEYLPPAGKRWSRFWLRGSGWPRGLPAPLDVPGLVPASSAGRLLARPHDLAWNANDAGNWGGANRWLEAISRDGPLWIVLLGCLFAFFAGAAIYLISRDEPARFASFALRLAMLVPAAFLLSGALTHIAGGEDRWAWLFGSWLMLAVGAEALGLAVARMWPRVHSLWATFATGLAVTLSCGPTWSIFSPALGPHVLPVSPEGVGCLLAYLTGAIALARGSSVAVWMMRGLGLGIFAFGTFSTAWWVHGQWPLALMPLFGLACGERLFRLWWLVPMALVPLADSRLLTHGLVWAPGDLFLTESGPQAVNAARHVEFAVSPMVFGTFAMAALIAAFVERYFFHRIKRAWRREPRVRPLLHATAGAAALGLFQPLTLYASLMCAVGGTFALLIEAARTD